MRCELLQIEQYVTSVGNTVCELTLVCADVPGAAGYERLSVHSGGLSWTQSTLLLAKIFWILRFISGE